MTAERLIFCAGARTGRRADAAVPNCPAGDRASAAWERVPSDRFALASHRMPPSRPGSAPAKVTTEEVRVASKGLAGRLQLPRRATALVLFVDTGGIGGRWPGDVYAEHVLHRHGLGTLHVDLLNHAAKSGGHAVGILASGVGSVLGWIGQRPDIVALPIGLMAADAGAAAAMVAAALRPETVRALVSRGGHPDLAAGHLACVAAPTLLIVGSADPDVLAANRAALRQLACNKRLEVLPGATNGFEEPGALESVAELAAEWFDRHLAKRGNG